MGDQPIERALELAHVRVLEPRERFHDALAEARSTLLALLPQNGDARLVVGRADVHDEPA